MARHRFTIDWNSTKAEVEFEDDMSYGKFSDILAKTVDVSNMTTTGSIKIDIPQYIDLVLQNSITQAPFNPNKKELDSIGRKLYAVLIKEILAYYPLGESLEPWATAMLGNTEQMKSFIGSMPSVQANSDGTRIQ